MTTDTNRSQDTAPKLPPAGKMTVPFKTTLVTHRDVARAFGVSIPTLMRSVKKGEFVVPHSLLGSFHLFDRATIEHRLEHGTWPKDAKFHGARNVSPPDDDGDA